MKYIIFIFVIICILFGVASGIYFQFADDSNGDDEKQTNFRKGFFRLALVFSIVLGIGAGAFFAHLAKKDELADEDDSDPPPKYLTNPKPAFFIFSIFFSGFVWLLYFIIQWPVYYVIIFVINGFKS